MRRRVADLTDLIRVLWINRIPIIVATVVAGVVAAGVSLILPKSYEANAFLLITESRIASSEGGVGLSSFFNPRLYPTFEGHILRGSTLKETLERFPQFAEREWAVEDLSTHLSVALIPNSQRIRVSVTLFDPQLAADVANHIAEQAEEYTSRELYADEAAAARERLAPELAQAQAEFASAEAALAAAYAHGTVESLQSHLNGLIRLRDNLLVLRAPVGNRMNTQLQDQASAAPVRQRYFQLLEERRSFLEEHHPDDYLAQREILWTQRALLSDSITDAESNSSRLTGGLESLEGISDANVDLYLAAERARMAEQLGGLQAQAERDATLLSGVENSGNEIDDQYLRAFAEEERLTSEVDLAQREYEALYAESTPVLMMRLSDYDQQLMQVEASAEQVRALIGEVSTAIATAQSRLDIAEGALSSIQTTYSEAALRLEERQQGLKVVDEAFAPTYPAAPRKKLLTILAAGLAFLCACVVVIARENMLAVTEESKSAS